LVPLLAACGAKPVFVPFAESPAFHERSSRVYGILERDLDGDGLIDAVIALRNEHGFAPQVFHGKVEKERIDYTPACLGPVLEGDDLDAMRWVPWGEDEVLFMVVLDETPDQLAQSFALVDLRGDCATLHHEQVLLPRGDDVLAPAELRAGVAVDGGQVIVIDEPEYLHLTGREGELEVPTSVRARRIVGGEGETRLPVIVPQPMTAHWGDFELPELVDGAVETSFVVRDAGVLQVTSGKPLVLLELQYGCGPLPVITLRDQALALDAQTPTVDWVRGIGHKSSAALVALTEPATELQLGLQATSCLRELRGYSFR
jgi:hypothetical protein